MIFPALLGCTVKAVQYQPGLKNDIGAELLAEGKALFENGQHKTAENYFMAAANVNPDIKETIADYYFQAGNKPEASMDLKTICFDNAVKFSQKESIKKAYAECHYELSKQAKTTEEAVSELKIANQFGNQFSAELQLKQEQLEQEKLQAIINEISQKYGKKPDFDELLNDKNKSITIFNNPKLNDGFIYIATSSYIGFDDAGTVEYPEALKSPETVKYTGYKYINGALKIKRGNKNSRVAIWLLNKP